MKVCISVEVSTICFIWFIIKQSASVRKSAVVLVHSMQYYELHLLYYVYFYRNWTQWRSTTRLCWTWTRSRRRASRSWPSSCSSPPSPPSPLETCCCSTANTRYAAVFYLQETNYSSKDSHWPAKPQVKDAFLGFLSSHVPAVDVHFKHKQSVWWSQCSVCTSTPCGQKLRLLQTLSFCFYSRPCMTPVTVYFLTVIITCSCSYNLVFLRSVNQKQVVLNGTKNSLFLRDDELRGSVKSTFE